MALKKLERKDGGALYSPLVGAVFIFNLIVGTGTFALPQAFALGGWLISLFVVVFVAFTAFMTATFEIESMACANALDRWRFKQKELEEKEAKGEEEGQVVEAPEEPLMETDKPSDAPVKNDYEISSKMDLATMASMFFTKPGVVFFYIGLLLYLYGDMAIYGCTVSKSLRTAVCNYNPYNNSAKDKRSLEEWLPCFNGHKHGLTRFHMYQIFLACFIAIMLPFAFFNLQKTTWLQIITSVLRWIGFIIMITLASIRLYTGPVAKPPPPLIDVFEMPHLIDVIVYAFMCHHAIPGMVTPIRNKDKLNVILIVDFSIILLFYCLMSFTGAFAFSELHDLYTINFAPNDPDAAQVPYAWLWLLYFIALFPVFTISANYPILTITLRDNLKTLFLCEVIERPVDPSKPTKSSKEPTKPKKPTKEYHWAVDRLVFPLLAVVPPTIVIFFTADVGILVAFTGAFGGASVQYIIPALLVRNARTDLRLTVGTDIKNPHRSPFYHSGWIWFIVVWCIFSFGMSMWYHISVIVKEVNS